jgi:hypothetical protein
MPKAMFNQFLQDAKVTAEKLIQFIVGFPCVCFQSLTFQPMFLQKNAKLKVKKP